MQLIFWLFFIYLASSFKIQNIVTPNTTQGPDTEYYGLYSPASMYGWYCHWFKHPDGSLRAFAAVAKEDQKRQERWWPQLAYGKLDITDKEALFVTETVYPKIGFANGENNTVSLFFDYFVELPFDGISKIYDVWWNQNANTYMIATFDIVTKTFSTLNVASPRMNFPFPIGTWLYKNALHFAGLDENRFVVIRRVDSSGFVQIWKDSVALSGYYATSSFDPKTNLLYITYSRADNPNAGVTIVNLETLTSSRVVYDSDNLILLKATAIPGTNSVVIIAVTGDNTKSYAGTWNLQPGQYGTRVEIAVPMPGCTTLLPFDSLWNSADELYISYTSSCDPPFPRDSGHKSKYFLLKVTNFEEDDVALG